MISCHANALQNPKTPPRFYCRRKYSVGWDKIGDEVDMSLVDRKLILRSLDEVERANKIQDTMKSLLAHRKSEYKELAKGVK